MALGEEKIILIIAQVNTQREGNCSANIEIFSSKSFFLYDGAKNTPPPPPNPGFLNLAILSEISPRKHSSIWR